jgi:hypothetical protein
MEARSAERGQSAASAAPLDGLLIDTDDAIVEESRVFLRPTSIGYVCAAVGGGARMLRKAVEDGAGPDRSAVAELEKALARAALAKAGFDPAQPRDDHGRWTNGAAAASPPSWAVPLPLSAAPVAAAVGGAAAAPGASVLVEFGAGAMEALGALAATLGPGIVALLGIILVPTNRSLITDERLPDHPDIGLGYDRGAGTLEIYQDAPDGRRTIFSGSAGADGLFRDADGRVLARRGENGVAIDADGLAAAIAGGRPARPPVDAAAAAAAAGAAIASGPATRVGTRSDEPNLCPRAGPDQPGRKSEKDIAYQDQIGMLVNGAPPPRDRRGEPMAVNLTNPRTGTLIHFDNCRLRDGAMIEAKGTGYLAMLLKGDENYPWLGVKEKMLNQARDQLAAADGRKVIWYFAEPRVARYMRAAFTDANLTIEVRSVAPSQAPRHSMNITKSLDCDEVYSVTSYWGPRPEPPAALATRYLRMIASLSAIDPAFGNWHFFDDEKATPLQGLRHADVMRMAEDGVWTAEDGTPTPQLGYRMGAGNGRKPARFAVTVSIHAGNREIVPYFINSVLSRLIARDDEGARAIDVDLLKAAVLAIVAAWNVTYAAAYPVELLDLWADAGSQPASSIPHFQMAWITYLSSRFAPLVTPPPSAIASRTPDGGLLMIATEERFDIANPTHMAVARAIEAALAPVNALPWPPDPTPE